MVGSAKYFNLQASKGHAPTYFTACPDGYNVDAKLINIFKKKFLNNVIQSIAQNFTANVEQFFTILPLLWHISAYSSEHTDFARLGGKREKGFLIKKRKLKKHCFQKASLEFRKIKL